MLRSVNSAILEGVSGRLIEIECNLSSSLPTIVIVGLGSKSVDESKERIRSAFSQSGLNMPTKRITLNLAPADISKDGSHFDLPMALSILLRSEQIPTKSLDGCMAVGELGLDGSVKDVRGIIGYALTAKKYRLKTIFVPHGNIKQASMVSGIKVIPIRSLREIYLHLIKDLDIAPASTSDIKHASKVELDLSEIKGNDRAKRALIISAAGAHNILFTGPPGTGKSMLAKAYSGVLPNLNLDQILEVTQLHSLARRSRNIVVTPPFRLPHHTSSHVAILGGGKPPQPGEVSLAHNGVLLLDELPEFNRLTLEGLRQPLEDGSITIARADTIVRYPANFSLVATQNPCPCGFYGDEKKECVCLPSQRANYQKKLSGPLKDRFDLSLSVPRIKVDHVLSSENPGITSRQARKLVLEARKLQAERNPNQVFNSDLSNDQLQEYADVEDDAKELLLKAADKLHLSPRSTVRCLRVSRTIADLDKSSSVNPVHISEALQYRE